MQKSCESGSAPIVPGRTYGARQEAQAGPASREDVAAGVWSVCHQQPAKARRREAGDVQFPRLYAHLSEEEKQRNVYGAEVAGEVSSGSVQGVVSIHHLYSDFWRSR